MNITEQANKYAEGKANEAITKAIADAYMEGYKAGYKDREEEIPMELRDNKTEYVDLGLPSGTLWAADYEELDGERLYLPYCKAEKMKLPTQEQWEELRENCHWKYKPESSSSWGGTRCVGPNGNELFFTNTGRRLFKSESIESSSSAFFWLEDNGDSNYKHKVSIDSTVRKIDVSFSGYRLPIRLVR